MTRTFRQVRSAHPHYRSLRVGHLRVLNFSDRIANSRGDVVPSLIAITPARDRLSIFRKRLKVFEWRQHPVTRSEYDRDNVRLSLHSSLECFLHFDFVTIVRR